MRLGWKASLVAAAMVCAAAPALGYSADGVMIAVDYAWRANDTGATSLTVAPGEKVTFSYPNGIATHNLAFTGRQPDCPGLVPYPRPKGWTVTCTFAAAGSYPFLCEVHDEMVGTVVVAAPTPSPTPTPTPTAGPGDPSTPAATPAPTPDATGTGTAPTATVPQAAVKLKVASRQKGTRVRGSVDVTQAGSRLVVTVRSGKAKAGSWTRKSSAAGTVAFSVPLDAKTRRALRAKRRLKLTVTVALTPPGAKTLTRTAKATVSL